jgi:predicted helicase
MCAVSLKSREATYFHPLYLYPEETATRLFDDTATSPWPPDPAHGHRVPNLSADFVAQMEEKLGLAFDPHKTGHEAGERFGPEDVLAYIYAVFHSPTYRERYAEFLKIDFPRVPLTADAALFWQLVALGGELVALHLLEHPALDETLTSFPVPGSNQVKRRGGYPKYTPPNPAEGIGGRVRINEKQYFEGVPEDVWAFQVGGYQVLHKWLKDRKGRVLSYDELAHYQRVVVALRETMRLMDAVDGVIPGWPLE